ncbi:LamG-like jellyroll fold domain-containing protein [Oceanispirochaeta sp.]|uniref:LamG-like jellyroll fold domain-containing protein n=1 Tax=Oceanispirochaeta sp. TaxID=2035350 RepID=UPI00261E447E|nr:LamG-like jellyroll fold domain-containing protein [Oceanispirochaeta sp.]MDA3955607.1 hypothetical protein [Oceanispirochaeta sp.]
MKILKKMTLLILLIASLAACRDSGGTTVGTISVDKINNPYDWTSIPPSGGDISDLEANFLQTFELEKITGLEERGVRPVLLFNKASFTTDRATIPVWSMDDAKFSTKSGSLSDYPETGLTTSWVVSDSAVFNSTSSDPLYDGKPVYKITSTTSYPAANTLLESYVEEYYVADAAVADTWNADDPIVNDLGELDPLYRVKMDILFDDGSIRHEKIVKIIAAADAEDGFAPLDIQGSLSYPDFSYPGSDSNANFSSVVVYSQEISTSHDYWFWDGTVTGALLGVRYYTEHFTDGGASYTGTMVAYERAIETYKTLGGSFAGQLDEVFIGSENTTLAESVMRKEVVFDVIGDVIQSGAVDGNTVMRTHVVDTVGSSKDFLLQQLNENATVFHDWESTPYHIPSGTTADEVEFALPQSEVVVNSYLDNPDGDALPLFLSASEFATSDFANLYQSIQTGEASQAVIGGDDVNQLTVDYFYDQNPYYDNGTRTSVMDDVGVAVYDGAHGTLIENSDNSTGTGDLVLNPIATGTIEAWVYVDVHSNFAGIVHKGVKHDFSDEGYTLQFWDRGRVSFGIVEQSPRYKYSLQTSSLSLNTGKWYYIIGRWDSSSVYLDLYYNNASGKTKSKSYSGTNTLSSKQPFPESGPLIIGSQYLEDYGKIGFYGFDGKINGVFVSDYNKSNAELLDFYNYMKDRTSSW